MDKQNELIRNMAHEWKQPLMEISALLMKIEVKAKIHKKLEVDETLDTINEVHSVINSISKIVDSFRTSALLK